MNPAPLARYMVEIGGRAMRCWWLMMGLASAASAEPVYLNCALHQGSTDLPVQIAANEAEQQAIVTLPTTGRVATSKAVFTPSEVRVFDPISVWVVDRVKLSLLRHIVIGENVYDETGSCSLEPTPPKRAF